MSLIYVQPSELHGYWGYVQPRLEIVARKSKARWIPEDIYHAVRSGASTLHIGEVGDIYVGFVVLTPSVDFDAQTLTVWALYSEKNHDVIELYDAEIVRFARKIKAKRLRFTSPRKWEKRLRPYGYHPVAQCYEREM